MQNRREKTKREAIIIFKLKIERRGKQPRNQNQNIQKYPAIIDTACSLPKNSSIIIIV